MGGIIAVGLVVSTLIGVGLIAHEWAPDPVTITQTEYISKDGGFDLVAHDPLNAMIADDEACRRDNKGWALKRDKETATPLRDMNGNSAHYYIDQ